MTSFYYKQIQLKKSHVVYLYIYTFISYIFILYIFIHIVKNSVFSINRNRFCKNRNQNQKIRIKIRLTEFQTENLNFKILNSKLTKKNQIFEVYSNSVHPYFKPYLGFVYIFFSILIWFFTLSKSAQLISLFLRFENIKYNIIKK